MISSTLSYVVIFIVLAIFLILGIVLVKGGRMSKDQFLTARSTQTWKALGINFYVAGKYYISYFNLFFIFIFNFFF